MVKFYLLFSFLFFLNSCATIPYQPSSEDLLVYIANDDGAVFSQFAPVFAVEVSAKPYNRIGTPMAYKNVQKLYVTVDPDKPAVYVERRFFATEHEEYTNLIYRIHFPEVPDDLIPFQLTAGKNVGLLVIVTLNHVGQPVLYTTVHTCGCYLAFFPTNFMSPESYSENWPENKQKVYGVVLPSFLDLTSFVPAKNKLMFVLRDRSHRVIDVSLMIDEELHGFNVVKTELYPVTYLEQLPLNGNGTVSFFEQTGRQAGYVRDNSKIRERILMSWWAFDWWIGKDKKLGRDKKEPPEFYTSLKPWARDESDLRDFPTFLKYWGWNL